MILSDYSTQTGLRVRITSAATGTTVQLTGEEWDLLVEQVKAGNLDGLAEEPKIPFVFWPEGKEIPVGEG